MAAWWRGLVLLLLVCLVAQSTATTDETKDSQELDNLGLNFHRHRALLQAGTPPVPSATPPTPVVTPPTPVVTPPTPVVTPPTPLTTPPTPTRPAPAPSPRAPSPAPILSPASLTPVRTYLMWVGIGAFCLVLLSVAVFCLCRKFGQQKVRGAHRLPPLPRYH